MCNPTVSCLQHKCTGNITHVLDKQLARVWKFFEIQSGLVVSYQLSADQGVHQEHLDNLSSKYLQTPCVVCCMVR